jgi:antitoxin component of MazEF toxin-antitoxin module
MRRKLTKVGNSWGLIISREMLDLLGVREGSDVEVELAGNTLVVTAPTTERTDVEAGLAYLISKRARSKVYERLAE